MVFRAADEVRIRGPDGQQDPAVFRRDVYIQRFTLDPADYALRAAVYAERTLQAGFTTVRDLGDRYNVTVALRKAIDAGLIDGPRVYTAAKSLATTGGHGDPTNGWSMQIRGDPRPMQGVINGPGDAARAVRYGHIFCK